MATEVDIILARQEEQNLTTEERLKAAVMRVMETCLSDILPLVGKDDTSSDGGQYLVELMEEVVIVVKRKLLFSPRLEYFYASQLKAVEARSNNGNAIYLLENKLTEAQGFRAETLQSLDEVIETIEEQILRLEAESHDQVVLTRSKTLNDLAHMESSSVTLRKKLQEGLLQKEEFYRQLEQSHLQNEVELREKRKIIEAEILETIDEYDATMEELHKTKNKIKDEETKLSQILQRKQEEFKGLEVKYKTIQEEKGKEEERKMAAIQEEFHREHSARVIQKAWSHYKMKKMLKNAKKKGRKKKVPPPITVKEVMKKEVIKKGPNKEATKAGRKNKESGKKKS